MHGPTPPRSPYDQSAAEEGMKLAKNYMWRQFWKLKFISVIMVGLMVWYTVSTERWIPLLDFNGLTWFMTLMVIAFFQIRSNMLFAFHVKHMRKYATPDSGIMKSIVAYTWVIWAFTQILMYWVAMMAVAGFVDLNIT